MRQRTISAAFFLLLFTCFGLAQNNPFPKFKVFKGAVTGIDFFASQKDDVDPFIKPLADARGKMASFLGDDLGEGAVFVCSTLAQKDSIYDQRVLKFYKWYLVQLTAEAQREERAARMKTAAAAAAASAAAAPGEQSSQGNRGQGSQSGRGEQGGRQGGPQGGTQSPEFRAMQEARAAAQLASQMGYAILMSSLNNEKPFRASRLDDMSRSPLNDWLDIALVAYAAGTAQSAYRVLQERVDDCFPLDDVLSMSRPFVAQTTDSSGGGMGGGGTGMFAAGAGGADRGGGVQSSGRGSNVGQAGAQGGGGGGRGGRTLSKDVVDRMVFDAQGTAFFTYLIQKVGIEKVKDLVQQQRKGTESVAVVLNLTGPDIDKTEMAFMDWAKAQK
jgi:hypothetical protein